MKVSGPLIESAGSRIAFKAHDVRQSMQEMADLDIPSISLKPTAPGLKDGVFESHSWISDEIRFVDAKINSMLTCFRGKRNPHDIGH